MKTEKKDSNTARKPRKRTFFRVFLLVVGALALAMIYLKLIERGANRMIANLLIDLIENGTNKTVDLDVDNIKVSVLSGTINVTDLNIVNSTEIGHESRSKLDIKLPEIHLNVDGIWLYWVNDFLNIQEVKLSRPNIKVVTSKERKAETNFSKEINKIITGLKEQLDLLEIDRLVIQNADVKYDQYDGRYYTRLTRVRDVSLVLTEFEWEDNPSKYGNLSTDGLTIQILNERITLPDSSYMIRFDSMKFSLRENSLKFENIVVVGLDDETSQRLEIPYLGFHGIDYSSSVKKNVLLVDSIRIEKPLFVVDEVQSKVIKKENQDKKALKALSEFFDSFKISKVSLNEGRLDISNSEAKRYDLISSDDIDLELIDLEILPFAAKPAHELVQFKDLRANIKNYISVGADSTLSISCRNILYDETLELLVIDTFDMHTYEQIRDDADAKVEIKTPLIKITGFDRNQYLDTRNVILDNILVDQLNVDFKFKDRQQKRVFRPEDKLRSYFSKGIKGVSADNIRLQHMDVALHKPDKFNIAIDNGNLFIDNFRINERTDLGVLLSKVRFNSQRGTIQLVKQEMDIKLSGLALDMSDHIMTSGRLKLEQPGLMFSGANFYLQYDSIPYLESNEVLLKKLSANGYNLKVDLTHQHLKGEDVEKKKPKIKLDQLDFINGNVEVIAEDLDMKGRLDTIGLIDLILDERINLTSIDLNLNNMVMNREEDVVQVQKLTYDSEVGSIYVNGIDAKLMTTKQAMMFSSPELTITGTDFNAYLNNYEVPVQSIWLKSWDLKIDYNTSANKKKTHESSKKGEWPLITIDQVKLEDGNVSSSDRTLSIEKINLTFADILLDSGFSALSKKDNFYIAKKLTGSIKKFFYDTEDTYLSFNQLNLSDSGEVRLNEFRMVDDGNEFAADKAYFKAIAYNDLITNQNVDIEDVFLQNPYVFVTEKADADSSGQTRKPSVKIERLLVDNADVKVVSKDKNSFELKPLDLKLVRFHYDSLTDLKKSLIPADSVSFTTRNVRFVTNNGKDEIRIKAINLTQNHNTIFLDDISIVPLLNREEYMEATGYETDYIEGKIDFIKVEGVNYLSLLNKENLFAAEHIIVNKPVFNIYRDKNYKDSLPDYRPLPSKLLLDLEKDIIVDSVYVNQASLTYSEVAEEGTLPGVLTFRSLDARIYNVTNMPAYIDLNPTLSIYTTSELMDIPFFADFKFFLNRKDGYFEMTGRLPESSLTKFNPLSQNAAFVKVESGECKRLFFKAVADDSLGYGHMNFQYSDLKVLLVNKETAKTNNLGESILSFFANAFIVKKRNLGVLKPRRGDIYFVRDQRKSIFNYMSKLVTAGVSSSVGLKNYRKEVKDLIKADYFQVNPNRFFRRRKTLAVVIE